MPKNVVRLLREMHAAGWRHAAANAIHNWPVTGEPIVEATTHTWYRGQQQIEVCILADGTDETSKLQAAMTQLSTAGGGVLLKGSLVGTPATNTALLAIGTVLGIVTGFRVVNTKLDSFDGTFTLPKSGIQT